MLLLKFLEDCLKELEAIDFSSVKLIFVLSSTNKASCSVVPFGLIEPPMFKVLEIKYRVIVKSSIARARKPWGYIPDHLLVL